LTDAFLSTFGEETVMVLVLGCHVNGPLGSYAPGLAQELSRRGYTISGASQHLGFIAHLDRWMRDQRLAVADLTDSVLDGYLAERRDAGYVNYRSMRAFAPLLGYLAPLGVLPVEPSVVLDPVAAVLERYRRFFVVERGLTASTARGYVDAVPPFLADRAGPAGLDLAGLTGASDCRWKFTRSTPGRRSVWGASNGWPSRTAITNAIALITQLVIAPAASRCGFTAASHGYRMSADMKNCPRADMEVPVNGQ
jgi:hypothetical protein